MLEVEECLLYESIRIVGVVVVGGVIGSAQSELSLRSCDHSIVGKTQNRRLLSFDEPIKVFSGLPDPNAQERIPEAVIAVPGIALKPVPALRTRAPINGDIERP